MYIIVIRDCIGEWGSIDFASSKEVKEMLYKSVCFTCLLGADNVRGGAGPTTLDKC